MSAQGGIKFPDGTVQTTAGVIRDNTLQGSGAPGSPLGVAVPLTLSVRFNPEAVACLWFPTPRYMARSHRQRGPKGAGLRAQGGSSSTIAGAGVIATGGNSLGSIPVSAGYGVIASGGEGNSAAGGMVCMPLAAEAPATRRQRVVAVGGYSTTIGRSGGNAIEAYAGTGENGAANGLAADSTGMSRSQVCSRRAADRSRLTIPSIRKTSTSCIPLSSPLT